MQSAFTDQECSNVLQPSTPERFVRFTNQSFYDVVFALTAQPGRYRAVPASKRCLDSYPSPSRSVSNQEYQDGFTDMHGLRVILFPSAFRFFWGRLHEPLARKGAWPTAIEVADGTGFILGPAIRQQLSLCCSYPRCGSNPGLAARC